jgi:hypothetical protein
MKKNQFKISISIIICFGLFTVLSKIYDNHFNYPGYLNDKTDWILFQKNKKLDFAIIGSSRVNYMADIKVIENKTHLKGINIGSNGASFNEMYLLLQMFIANGNQISSLLIQVDECSFDLYSGGYFHYWYYVRLLENKIVSEVMKKNMNLAKYYMWQYIPFSKYIEYNNIYKLSDVILNKKQSFNMLDSLSGYDRPEQTAERIFNNVGPIKYCVDSSMYLSFVNMIEFANEHLIKVTLFSAPKYIKLQTAEINGAEIREEILKISKHFNIRYLNFGTNIICQSSSNFSDFKHLNLRGAERFSQILGDSLSHIQ